jgi:hypothetical protein
LFDENNHLPQKPLMQGTKELKNKEVKISYG